MMYRYALAALVLSRIANATVAQAETIKPIKASKHDIVGATFLRKDAVHEDKDDNASTDVVTFTSSNAAFQTGVYKSGSAHEEIKGPQGFPYNEFLYFSSGRVRLTSSDGSVMHVNAGEAVTLPKGWTGHFDTQGYTKLYVTYNPDDEKNSFKVDADAHDCANLHTGRHCGGPRSCQGVHRLGVHAGARLEGCPDLPRP
ncbi:cupin domain-containing protein [Bradyrhizobium sp. Ash2021]|uniref:cupin domain-containing protein n=1 Tax=Bradyrhizobium sp. Ash2021 TaxID=2954771 RepID=UPI002816562D|nr:cupin domain-containing protein [Bradyrhizobium sp. Ash2021]WMT79408.1 cupin domain-containing protein [Bradyrhizobium sp. Ash2021]